MKSKLFTPILLAAVLFVGCSKEDDDPKTAEAAKTTTVTNIDTFYIDYTTKMNYTITVLSGNHVTIGPGKSSALVEGAKVTAVQGGVKVTQTTDASGMATFNGLYKGAITVSISKDEYTQANYIVTVNNLFPRDSTNDNQATSIYVSNQVPIFKIKNDDAVARLMGRVTYQSDLTNITREGIPEGTRISAYIDASDPVFFKTYLETKGTNNDSVFGGKILQIAYEGNFSDSTDAQGNYDMILPAAIAGLPIRINASDLVTQQIVFENTGVEGYNRTKEYRTLFGPTHVPSPVPAAGGAAVTFDAGSGAIATASVSGTGQIDQILITNGGSGYTSAPKVTITGGGGSGAQATATVSNGIVTAINIVSGGAGYSSNPFITISGGAGAAVNATIGGGGNLASVQVVNSGSGYLPNPIVTVSAPSLAGGVNATVTANVQNGNITGFVITNPGSGYTANPTITIAAPVSGVQATAIGVFSGFSVQNVTIVNTGSNYTGNPTVTFSNPDMPTGTKAQGVATINPTSGEVIGFTITNPGSGYINPPSITLSSGSGATASAQYSGRVVSGITIVSQGDDYIVAPKVKFTGGGGSGAAAVATVVNGKVININITSAGSGYTSAPSVELISGTGAQASVVVSGGQITAINLVNGGFNYTGAPKITISPLLGGPGSGATATATVDVATGAVTGISITNPGTGYLGGNTPSISEPFSINPALTTDKLLLKPGGTYIRDIHYGTGMKMPD